MRGFGAAVDAVNTANDAVQLSQARYNVELQNLIRGLPEAADQTRNLAIQQAAAAKSAAAQAEAARTAADSADQLAAAAEKTVQAQLEALQTERDLAVARGDTAAAGRLSVEIYKLERTSALANAQALQASADAARTALEAKQKAAAASGDFTAKTRDEIEALQQEVAQKDASARAALARAKNLTDETREEERLLVAMRDSAKTSYELAVAKGNEYQARRQLTLVAQTEARLAQLNAEKKLIELKSANAIVAALQREIQERQAAGEAIDEATIKRLRSATIAQETAAIESAAAGRVAEAERQKAAATALGNIGKDKQTDATQKNTQATDENTQATEKQVKVVDNVAKMYEGLIAQLQGARERTSALSEATGLYFEAILQGTLAFQGMEGAMNGAGDAWNDFLNAGSEGSNQIAEFTKKLGDAKKAAIFFESELLTTVNMMDTFVTAVAGAETAAKAAFYEQALAAENLRVRIEEMTKSAGANLESMAASAEKNIGSFGLLDEEDLSGLRSAIDDANAKLREMKEATDDARFRLAELNAELLEAQGLDQKAELLRQQLDYQQTLAEIEARRQEAELMGNRELVTILTEQKSTLDQINRVKVANIQADSENQASTDAATQRVSRLADETERAARAMNTLGSSSLATLSDQAGSLRQHLQSVNSLL